MRREAFYPLATGRKRRFHDRGITTERALADPAAEQQKPPRLDIVVANDTPPPRMGGPRAPLTVRFNRHELQAILDVYGRHVAQGAWRDYAIDFLKDRALFSIYRNHSERPLYVIEKNPKNRERQGQFMLISQHGRVLKRGHELDNVLRVLEPSLSLVKS